MKRKILGGIAVLSVALVAAWNMGIVLKAGSISSNATLANIEAVAQTEDLPEVVIECSGSGQHTPSKCWEEDQHYESHPPFYIPMCYTFCSNFTGYTWMVCYPNFPC